MGEKAEARVTSRVRLESLQGKKMRFSLEQFEFQENFPVDLQKKCDLSSTPRYIAVSSGQGLCAPLQSIPPEESKDH